MSESLCLGTVRDYDPQRGYGRIVDAQQREFFVHYRELRQTERLLPGQQVRFEPQLQRKGNMALQVTPL